MNNPMNHNVALVITQYVEDYGIGAGGSKPHFKFKGGSSYIVETDKDATALGVVLGYLASTGRSAGEYPRSVHFFASKDEAIASLDEWEREYVKEVSQPV